MQRHFTVTSYITEKQRFLLIFHPKFSKWLPPGGHLEENELPHEGAKREALEETGLEIEFIYQENIWINELNAISIPRPYLCLLENIPEHSHEPEHQHMDLIYLARPKSGVLLHDELEKGRIKWFSLEEAEALAESERIFPDTLQIIRLFQEEGFHTTYQMHEIRH